MGYWKQNLPVSASLEMWMRSVQICSACGYAQEGRFGTGIGGTLHAENFYQVYFRDHDGCYLADIVDSSGHNVPVADESAAEFVLGENGSGNTHFGK